MKGKYIILIISVILLSGADTIGQDVYRISSGEMIFGWADVQLSDEYKTSFPLASVTDTPVRFTLFLHFGHYIHMDFNNNLGVYTGTVLRNVGFISDEVLPDIANPESESDYENYKIVRRSYTLGVPLALKIGSFKDHMYFFGGGEIEWAFVTKTKWWNSHSRDGAKTKKVDWFPSTITQLQPSVFAGVQFPGGVNIKYRYYLDDFVSSKDMGIADPLEIDDLSRYSGIHMMHISVCWQYRHKGRKVLNFDEYVTSSR
jgi:hypothetical protein